MGLLKAILKRYYILGILLIIATSLGLIIQYSYLNNTAIKNNEKNIENTRRFLGSLINAELNTYTKVISNANNFIIGGDWKDEDILDYFNHAVEVNPVFNTIFFSDENKRRIMSGDLGITYDHDSSSRPWYQKAITQKQTVYSEVYVDLLTDELTITISEPVLDANQDVIGVVAGDILINNIISLVKESSPNDFGYSFLIDDGGNLLTHRNQYDEEAFKNINDINPNLLVEMQREGTGRKLVEIDGVEGFLAFQPIQNTDLIIGSFASLNDHAGLSGYLWKMFAIGISVMIILFIAFLYLQKRYYLNPLNSLVTDINSINIESNMAYRIPAMEKDPFITPRKLINSILNKTEVFFKGREEYSDELASSYDELSSIKLKIEEQYDILKKSEKKLFHLSYYDHTTGLFNRRYFVEELDRLDLPENLPLGLIIGDVNGLKLINDSFGHTVGDELLQTTATILLKSVSKKDVVSRIGGDEFVIILPNTSFAETELIIKNIRQHSKENKIENINLSISFGTSIKFDETELIIDILKDAEDKMYSNKLVEGPSMRSKTIDTIVQTLYEKSPREEAHSTRVAYLCQRMGHYLGMNDDKIKELETVGRLHDIGKIAISNTILEKTGKLNEEEWREMERHPEIGYRILRTINEIAQIANYVLAHHERYDGKGYPQGLSGDAIPLVSRIISIADAYDAMTCDRPYRNGLSEEQAAAQIIKCAGTQFDPDLARLFVEKVLGKEWIEEA